jgi:hypothetical protein
MGDPANRNVTALVTSAHATGEKAESVVAGLGADWPEVIAGPAAALAAVATADLSGPVGSIKVARAAADALALIARQAPPGSVLMTAFGAGLTTEMLSTMKHLAPTKDALIDLMRAGAAAVAVKSPADDTAYKDALLAVAKATAEASKDGGFPGIGCKLVSDDEQQALDAISAALARTPCRAGGCLREGSGAPTPGSCCQACHATVTSLRNNRGDRRLPYGRLA